MKILRRWCSRLLATIRRDTHDREFRAEMESHLQFMVDERVARGMSPESARREALLKLGGLSQLGESHRQWRGASWLEATLRDVRQAHRRRVSTTLRQSAKEFSEYSFLENPMRRVC